MGVRREFLEKLLSDREYSRKLEQAKTDEEVLAVLREFAQRRGLKVKVV